MNKLIALNLGQGNLQNGFPMVTGQIWEVDRPRPIVKVTGSLPAAPELPLLYQRWQLLYQAFYQFQGRRVWRSSDDDIEIDDEDVTNFSQVDFIQSCQNLQQALNDWLNSLGFQPIDRKWRSRLDPSAEFRVIIESEDREVQQLPWYLWHFFDDYRQAEIALSSSEYIKIEQPVNPPVKEKVKILAVLGNSQGIDTQKDRAILENLPKAIALFLVEPSLEELNHQLWQESWDILFFAGHSSSQKTGLIQINQTESLTIPQLKHGLRKAMAGGLRLAIFNSCDGLGLAQSLADLSMPQTIVMREPVPDLVAQEFLKYFLTGFAAGKSLYLAVREARERLQGLENNFPCATWLPVIYQNPAEDPPRWQDLSGTGDDKSSNPNEVLKKRRSPSLPTGFSKTAILSIIVTLIVMAGRSLGILENLELSAYDHLIRIRPPEALEERILVVEITDDDVKQYGYPLSDATLAAVIKKLYQYQPRMVGIDLHRHQKQREGRQDLIGLFKTHKDLLLVCKYNSSRIELTQPLEFSPDQLRSQVGFSNLPEDLDLDRDTIRRYLLSYDPKSAQKDSGCTTPFSFSFHLAYRFIYGDAIGDITPNANYNWQLGKIELKKLAFPYGGYQKEIDKGANQIMINYRSPAPSGQIARKITVSRVLEEPTDRQLRQLVEDKMILIGVTAADKDDRHTPSGNIPGVWIHAQMISQMMEMIQGKRSLIWILPTWGKLQWGDAIFIWIWSMIGGLLFWYSRSYLYLFPFAVGATVILHQICLLVLVNGGWLPLIPAILSISLTIGILISYNFYNIVRMKHYHQSKL